MIGAVRDVALAPIGPEHVGPAYVAWLNDPEVVRFTELRFRSHDLASTLDYVRRMNDSPGDRLWRIVADGRHVGNAHISGIGGPHRRGALAVLIGDRAAWGKGIARRAVAAAAMRGFGDHGLRKISAGIYASNLASLRAFEHAGFAVEAVLRAHRLLDGKPEDEIQMARFAPSEFAAP